VRVLVLPAFLAVSLVGLMACPAGLSHTSARTLDHGSTEVTLSLGGMAAEHEYSPPVLPLGGVQVRHGISDRIELGATLGTSGAGARMKVGLVRSESASSGFSLSVEPGATVFPLFREGTTPYATLQLPVHLGFRIGGDELTLSPRVVYSLHPDISPTLYAGSSIGYSFSVGESIQLTPEFGLLVPVVEADPSAAPVIPTFGLGFTWGR
jgi:hypothetical protein